LVIDRTRRQRRRAIKTTAKRLLAAAAVSVVILSSLYLYNYLTTAEWLSVDEVHLNGVYRVSKEDLEKRLEDLKGQNILLLPLDNYVDRIENHPRVRRASLRRILPNQVVCEVEEREPVALVFTGRFLEVDGEGMILGEDRLTPLLDLPIISGIERRAVEEGKICQDPRLRDALVTLDYCKRFGGRFAEEISELRISSGGLSIVSLKENSTLLLGNTDYENRLEKYFLLKNSIESDERSAKLIDLRFADQIVLRNKL
jgi:cell division septal protein FtsQ